MFQLIDNLYLNWCGKKQIGHVEVNSAFMVHDLKDAETNLVVVICLNIPWYQFALIYDRDNLTK